MKSTNFKCKIFNIFIISIIVIIPIPSIQFFFNLNPSFTSLQQRSQFFSLSYQSVFLNENNSKILQGSQNDGIIITTLEIPQNFVKREFFLEFEAEGFREWDYIIRVYGDLNYFYITHNTKIEIKINNITTKIINLSNLDLKNYKSIIKHKEYFNNNISRNQILVNLITEHKLFHDQKIFEDFFIDKNYKFTISIGDTEFLFNLLTLLFIVVWFLFVLLKKKNNKYN